MSTSNENLSADKITFFSACRENTGAHFLDSGGAYGRHHEREELDPNGPEVTLDFDKKSKRFWGATLSTPHYLDARYKIRRDLQAAFDKFAAAHPGLSWFEASEQFMDSLGPPEYSRCHRGNPYNDDNDLSQVFVYEIWQVEADLHKDTFYAFDNTVVVLFIHTGCDVREGYGRPLFCKPTTDYAIPVDYVVEFRAVNGYDKDHRKLDAEALCKIDEKWRAGYSGSPSYQLEQDIETVKSVKGTVLTAVLKTGETVKIQACAPYAS